GLLLDDPGLFEVVAGDSTALGSFTNFPLYTLDHNYGTVLFPGFVHYATPGGHVDLRAQVRDTAVASYSWDTSGLTEALNISGTSTYRLQFDWDVEIPAATTNTATLTVTDTNNDTEVQTYTFRLPESDQIGGGSGGSSETWPTSL